MVHHGAVPKGGGGVNDRTMCDNCGYESDDVTTYWFSPKFKIGWDGTGRLVFPHVRICSACQEQPFRRLDSGHTVSSITGQVLWDNGEKNPGPESFMSLQPLGESLTIWRVF